MKSLRHLFLLAVGSLLVSCHNGGGSEMGEVSLLLTDAAGDELAQFEVDVSNVVLTKLGGSTVSVMPRATRLDFTELESVGELVAGKSLETGLYTKLTMTLDFTAARVLLQDQTTPATVLDPSGNPIVGPIDVVVDFAAGARPLIGTTRSHLLSLDLDLDQSLAVDAGNNQVTFTPVLNAELDPADAKPVTTAGVLRSVDVAGMTFVVERRAVDDSVMDTFTVGVASSTVFQVDGVVQVGANGLGWLVNDLNQRVLVQGSLGSSDAVLHAVTVEAGAGVRGNGQDWLVGHVVARSGGAGVDPVLTVLGRSVEVGTGAIRYNTLHTVNTSLANTKVLRRGAGNNLDTDAINVGQLVAVFGDLTGTTLDATATTGVARLLRTSIFGVAVGAPVGETLTLEVARFDLRDASHFDFMIAGQNEADVHAFNVDVAGLSTAGITTGTKLRVLGWIGPVGVSGDRDATALSLVDRSTNAKVLFCQWVPSVTTALAAVQSSATAILLDVSMADIKQVNDGFAPVTLSAAPRLQALATVGAFRIVEAGGLELHFTFASFRQALLARTMTTPVFRISAFGTFDTNTQVFSAATATVVLH